jgi:hypothetical protein
MKDKANIDLYIYVFDQKNSVAAWTHKELTVNADRFRDVLTKRGLTMRASFDLKPGTYTAKAVVRLKEAGLTGFDRTSFGVTQ